jgi:hypothetical protein
MLLIILNNSWLLLHCWRSAQARKNMADFEDDHMDELDEIDQTLSCEGLFEEFSVLFTEIKENQSPLSIQNRLNAVISR